MSDAFFPASSCASAYVPAGTITATTYFHASPDELAAQTATTCWARRARSRFSHGRFDQYAQLWGGETLLATSHHSSTSKDPQGLERVPRRQLPQ